MNFCDKKLKRVLYKILMKLEPRQKKIAYFLVNKNTFSKISTLDMA